jgi:glycosyltransferase involved in cell wall biosynthesis
MMRIAMVTTHPPGQGSLNEYAYHFVRYLRQKAEIEELILLLDELLPGDSYNFDTNNDPDEVPIKVIPCWRFNSLSNPLRILKEVYKTKPDLVLFNIQFASFGKNMICGGLGLLTPYILRKNGFPTVVLLHNIMETIDLKQAGFAGNPLIERTIRFAGQILTRLLLEADLVAVTIPKYVEILQEAYHANNIFLAPHGSFEEPGPLPSLDLPPGPTQLMAFGKFGTYKRVEVLIEAFKILKEKTQLPLELVIAGSDSPNAPGYLDRIHQTYADVKDIRFTGYVAEEDVPRIFGEASVVVFPYNSTTGSSGVLHQAGSYGKAVVLPNLGDLAELIQEEGYSGEFFEAENASSLVEAITCFLNDPEYRRRVGTQNFLASQGVPMSEVIDWYLFHFETLLNQSVSNHSANREQQKLPKSMLAAKEQ